MYKRFLFLIFGVFIGFVETDAQESYNRLIFEGNRNFKNKDYETSSSKFSKAEKIDTKDFVAHYNLANSYYKRKMYEEAKSEYKKANLFAKNSADKAATLHNLGNSYMQTSHPERAAETYKQALKENPYDKNTRKNYEIAKLKEKEKKRENQDNKQDSKDKNQKPNLKNQGEKNSEKQDGKEPNPNNQNGNQPKPAKDEISKELQDAILNRVSEKEKETARKIINQSSYSTPESREKDW